METANGPNKYYLYILVYVNYMLSMNYDLNSMFTKLDKGFLL